MAWNDMSSWTGITLLKDWWGEVKNNFAFLKNSLEQEEQSRVSADEHLDDKINDNISYLKYYDTTDIEITSQDDFTWEGTTLNKYNGSSANVVIPYEHSVYNSELDEYSVYSVNEIGTGSFDNNTNITSVIIPKSVTRIAGYAFRGCTGVTSISIPNSVTEIVGYAFQGCTGLTSISIPDSVTHIWGYTFQGCTGLTSISIPNSVTGITTLAFQGCTGLTSISIPDSVNHIGNDTFTDCNNLTIICTQGSYAETYATTKNIPYKYDIANPVDLSGYYNKTDIDGKISTEVSERQTADNTKSDKTIITVSSDTSGTLTMVNNTEVRYGTVTSIKLVLPSSIPNDYISSIVFTSGTTAADFDVDEGATNFVYPDTIKMTGEDCMDGIFTPIENKRYTVILSYDGVYISGAVGGASI